MNGTTTETASTKADARSIYGQEVCDALGMWGGEDFSADVGTLATDLEFVGRALEHSDSEEAANGGHLINRMAARTHLIAENIETAVVEMRALRQRVEELEAELKERCTKPAKKVTKAVRRASKRGAK